MQTTAPEDHLSAADFDRLAQLVDRVCGIQLPRSKRTMVEGRLRRRLRALGLENFDAYCRRLFAPNGFDGELTDLIDVITTNKTDFFREPVHFDLLKSTLIPSLLALPRVGGQPMLKVWSAASSTGAEAYTAAMVLAEAARIRRDFQFAVLGTDISTRVLAEAERAVYTRGMLAPTPAAMAERYLMRSHDGTEARIVPELRRRVRFARMNLMDAKYPIDRDVDVIFLRNVLIYFDPEVQRAVVDRLSGHLRPGGYLILGLSESAVGAGAHLRAVAPAVFEKQ